MNIESEGTWEQQWPDLPQYLYPDSCLDRLSKTTINLSLDGVPAEFRTDHLPNTSQNSHSLRQLALWICLLFKDDDVIEAT